MDFDVDQFNGLHFIYALPFSERRLFVESTVISQELNQIEWYEDQIKLWMKNKNLDYLKKFHLKKALYLKVK